MIKKILFLFIFISSIITNAQTSITGTVFDEYLEPFPGAIISAANGRTVSDYEGVFKLDIQKLPITITISSIGHTSESFEITDSNKS